MSEWARTLLVGAGGFVGASLRYHLGGLVHRVVSPEFPWGTFVVNRMVQEGLVTIEKATVIFYRAGEPPAEP